MQMIGTAPECIQFGPFSLWPRGRKLKRGEEAVELGGRALGVLIALLEEPGVVQSHETLTSKVWQRRWLDDSNLRVAIAQVRRALDDKANRYIVNVPGQGYYFSAEAEVLTVPRDHAETDAGRFGEIDPIVDEDPEDDLVPEPEAPMHKAQASADSPITVLIVDDHVLLREGVRAVISAQEDIHVAGEAESGRAAIDAYSALKPDVVLMDLQMPDMNGLDAITELRRTDPDAKIIVLTTYTGDGRALKALRAGAMGYLVKASLRNELLGAIRSVFHGGKHLDAAIASDIALHVLDEALTEREIDVLSLAAWGNTNKQIARKLDISEETVKGYMKVAFSKLGATDRTHAVTIAAKRGLIEL